MRVLAVVVLVVVVLGTACGRSTGPRQPTAGGDGPMSMPADFPAGVEVDPGQPFLTGDHADPFMLRDATGYHLYTTNSGTEHIPAHADDPSGVPPFSVDAVPALPIWTTPGDVWAPAVAATPSGYVLYYATRDVASGRQCISVATASTPLGPFTDSSSGAAVCPLELGGAIDPSFVVDDAGVTWLLYKNDGNCCRLPTAIWAQRLSADLLDRAGAPVRVLAADRAWEDGVIEAPAMHRLDGVWYLFYSGNHWDTAGYAIGYATCASVSGPCTKPSTGPWFASRAQIQGPGGQEFFTDASGATWMVYAAWVGGRVGYPSGGARNLFLAPVSGSSGPAPRVAA